MDYKEFKAAVYARLDHATVGVKKIHNGGRRDISDLDDLAIRLSQHVLQLIPAKMAFRNIKDVSIYGLCVEYITDCNRCVNYEPSGEWRISAKMLEDAGYRDLSGSFIKKGMDTAIETMDRRIDRKKDKFLDRLVKMMS